MARPKKHNAEYFSHDADMRNDVKIKALRRRFSHTGFAVWCFLLETLTDNDFFTIEWDEINIELLAADYEVSVEELQNIVDYCVKIDLLQKEETKILSRAHQNRFAQLIANRERKRSNDAQTPDENTQSEDNGGVSASKNLEETPEETPNGVQNTHTRANSKVKYSKVKKSKEDKSKIISLSDAPASDTERDVFFEIFFFKNFKKPAEEVDRFCSNYESSGWVRKNGQPVVDRTALAKTWTPKDETQTPRFPANFITPWEVLYKDAKKQRPESARLLLHELVGAKLDAESLILICKSRALPELIERNISYFGRFFAKYFADKKLNYRVLNQ